VDAQRCGRWIVGLGEGPLVAVRAADREQGRPLQRRQQLGSGRAGDECRESQVARPVDGDVECPIGDAVQELAELRTVQVALPFVLDLRVAVEWFNRRDDDEFAEARVVDAELEAGRVEDHAHGCLALSCAAVW
jgi:hypothetical protein